MKRKILHLVFCIDNNFASHLGVLLTSIMANNTSGVYYNFHIISSGLNQDNYDKLKSYDGELSKVSFYQVNEQYFSTLSISKKFSQRLSVVTYFRLAIPELLPKHIDRVIFLDADMIVTSDLSVLWDMDISEHAVGVVEDALLVKKGYWKTLSLSKRKYFNAGMMIIDLVVWKKSSIVKSCMDLLEKRATWEFNDQDVLNVVLNKNCFYLDNTWNFQTANITKKDFILPKIIHYTGSEKPWHKSCIHKYSSLYQKYKSLSAYSEIPNINYLDNHDHALIKKLLKLPKYSRVAIYGCGQKGRRLFHVMNEFNNSIKIVFFMDKSNKFSCYEDINIYTVLPDMDFDFILIASDEFSEEMNENLISCNVAEYKIISNIL